MRSYSFGFSIKLIYYGSFNGISLLFFSHTRWAGRMSRESISHAGRLGSLNLKDLNLDPAGSNPGLIKSLTLKLIRVTS